MAALNNAALLTVNETFSSRCLAALVYQAAVVIGEAGANPLRKGLARSVILNPLAHKQGITHILASRPNIASQSVATMTAVAADLNPTGSEGLILQEVATIWDTYAGIVQNSVL
jgi:hypothetical protein